MRFHFSDVWETLAPSFWMIIFYMVLKLNSWHDLMVKRDRKQRDRESSCKYWLDSEQLPLEHQLRIMFLKSITFWSIILVYDHMKNSKPIPSYTITHKSFSNKIFIYLNSEEASYWEANCLLLDFKQPRRSLNSGTVPEHFQYRILWMWQKFLHYDFLV